MHLRGDFHIHSCLSPCGSLEMSPSAIVEQARRVGLGAIALADHNCGFNLPAFDAVCRAAGMLCLYGVEVTSLEEAHVLCLFDRLDVAVAWGAQVYDSLPSIQNDPDRFGDQPIVDEHEQILDFAEKLLISASGYDVGTLVAEVHGRGGLCIPAHIDRSVYGMVAQLGFLPDEPFDAVELTPRGDPALARDFPIVRNSDAHRLDAIGRVSTSLEIDAWSVAALRAGLRAGGVRG